MQTKRYKRWQVILGVILFLAVLGIAGREDYRAAEVLSRGPVTVYEKERLRDALKASVEADEKKWLAFYQGRVLR